MASQFEEVLAMKKTIAIGSSSHESPAMIESRTRTFISWINSKVASRGVQVTNLSNDMESGIVLIKLLECLAPDKKMPGRYYARPVIKIQKIQNLAIAFKFITDVEKISVTNIQPNDVLLHKEHCVISLIWLLILHYEIGFKMVRSITFEAAFLTLKRAALTWINGIIPGHSITNFNTDWKDGQMLSALIDYCQPGLIDIASLKASNATQNVHNALTIAKTRLGIESYMAADEFALEKPDEISVMMYLSKFYSSGSHGQQTLLFWIQQQIPNAGVKDFSSSWTSGMALGALTNAVSGGKFPSHTAMTDTNSLENIEQAMAAAEKLLGVRRIITSAKFAEAELDELFRLSYLAQFHSAKENTADLMAIPAAADKVEVSDIQIPNVLGEGKLVWVELDCSDAGYGEVRAEVKGRQSGKIPVTVKEIEGEDGTTTDKYRVSFKPKAVDVYDFSIYYGSNQVIGSPFSVNLYPPDPEKVVHASTADNSETGQDVALNFETKEAGRGKLSAKAEGEICGALPVKIVPLGDGTFAVSFHPQFPDIYTVDVFWGRFAAQAIGEMTGPVALQVNQDRRSEYLVSFKPQHPDLYMVDVSWDGKPVPGSPFIVDLLPPPMPEEVECAVPIYNEPGEEAELLVDASNAGSGEITANCSGEKVGDVEVTVNKVAGRTYQATFIPPDKDLYTLNILFDHKHVKGSPFTIDMRPGSVPEFGEIDDVISIQVAPDANKCFIINPPHSEILSIGNPLAFSIDCSNAGPGEIAVTADGPGRSDITVDSRPQQKNVFDVTFVPNSPSPYKINLAWSDKPIPKSPISVIAIDPETVVNFPYGKPVGLDCDVEGKSGDLKAVAIHDRTGMQYKVKITKSQKNKYKLSFSPKEPGLYRVHVTMKDKEIPESPFVINYNKPAKPEACSIGGLSRKCFVGEPLKFTVIAVDAGSGDLQVKVSGPKQKKDKSEPTVTDHKNGYHTVEYTPQTIGEYNFAISWAGKSIPGSPFSTKASERSIDIITDVYMVQNYGKPNESKKEIPSSKDIIKATLGSPLLLNFTVSDELKDEPFTATATGKDGPADLIITQPSSNIHSVLLNPASDDTYTIKATVGDTKAPRTPVTIQYSALMSDPSKCRIIGMDPLPTPLYVSKPIDFKVYTDGAGPGDLAVTADTPLVEEPPAIEVRKSPVESVYDVSYTPSAPGEHKLNVTWAGEPIPKSPLHVSIAEPSSYAHGQPVSMDINADCKPGDLEAHAVHVESNTPYKVKTSKVAKGKYKLTLEPKDPGYYHIHVFLKQNEIKGSPFVVKYGQKPQPEKCSVRDQPEFVYVNRPINFTIDTKGAGNGTLNIKASIPQTDNGQKPPELKLNDNKDGTFGVEYIPNTPGKHSFNVLWSGESIPGSPVEVDVRKDMDLTDLIDDFILAPKPLPIEEKVDAELAQEVEAPPPVIEEPEAPVQVERRKNPITIVVGKALKLKVKPKDDKQRNGILKARAHGEATGPSIVKTSQNDDGVFEVYFNPPEPDYYIVDVKLNNEHVPQSPFHVLYIPAPVEEPVIEAPTEEVEAFFVPDTPIDYHIDLSSIPSGKLSAKCSGEECGDVPVSYKPIEPDSKKYKVTFVPPQPDLYHLSVFFNDKEVKNSPYTIDLRKKPIIEEPVIEEPIAMVETTPQLESIPSLPPPPQEDSKENTPSPEILDAHTVEDVPTEEFTVPIGTALVVKIQPKSQEQKNGVLTGSAVGDVVGSSTDVSTYKQSDDVFMFYFDPTEPDRYTVDVRVDNTSVPRSPFRVNYIMPPIDASKCRLIGVKDIENFVEVGSEIELRVDAKKAGPGSLDVLAEKPSEEEGKSMLATSPSQKDRGYYDITYIPQSQGKHSLKFNWGDKQIPLSPVDILVVDPSSTEVVPNGKPASVDIEADGNLKAYCIHRESGRDYKVKTSKIHKGKYRLTFQPKDLGYYFLHVSIKDKELSKSPYIFRYARPAKPEAVKVVGLDTRAYIGETVDFTVDTRDAGEGDLSIKTLGVDGKETKGPQITDNRDGTFTGAFAPEVPGKHELHMTWGGRPVPGQPFPLLVRDHSKEELLAWLFEIDRTGDPRSINFPTVGEVLQDTTDHKLMLRVKPQTEEQKKEKLTATATNVDTGKKTNLKVTKKGDDTFEAEFIPSTPKTYTIEAQLGSTPVPHTPFTVKYEIPKPDAGKCKILGQDAHPDKFQVNRPIFFQVDTRLAGDGKLNLTADGVQVRPKLEAKANKEEPRIIDITYTPAAPGTHNIKVLWSGEPVPKSPLAFEVEPIPRYPYGKPIGYDLDVDAKPGDIDAHVIHQSSGARLKVKTAKLSKGKYRFSFSPKKPGLYALHISVKKKEIKQSPIYFLYEGPPDPSACVLKDLPENWYIYELESFTIDATGAGSGSLQVKVTPPAKGKDGELKVIDNEDGTYAIEHTPDTLGIYKFAMTWAGKPIPSSPLKTTVTRRTPGVKTSLGSYMNVVPVGDTVQVDVVNLGKYAADTNYVTATVRSKSGKEQPIVEDREGSSAVTLRPTVADDYTLSVKLHNEHVEGSPFLIKAVERPTLSKDYDFPEEATPSNVEVGKEVCLVLPKSESLPADLYTEVIGPEGPYEVKLIDQVESCYGLNFTPPIPGDYLLHVKKDKDDENELDDSPYKIRAIKREPDAQKVIIPKDFQSLLLQPIPLGSDVSFNINTADANYGTLRIKQRGEGKAVLDMTDKNNGVYSCKTTATERGRCELDILWNGEHIRGSPVQLTFVPVTGINLEGETFVVGTQNKFTVDRQSVIEGRLEISCSDPQAADISIQPSDDGKEFYCYITAKNEGDYRIIVKYNGYEIVGSPFKVLFQRPVATGMSFSLSAEGAETSDVSATVQNTLTLEQLPVNLTDLFGGKYTLEFVPSGGLEYEVVIKCRLKVKTEEKVIASSPFTLRYENLSSDARKCQAEGRGLTEATAGQWSSFFVNAEDAGMGELSVDISGDVFGDEEAVITALSPTKFEVKYLLHMKGTYKISVFWNGQEIPGSPFDVSCLVPQYDANFGPIEFPTKATLGEPIEFSLRPTAAVQASDIDLRARSTSQIIGVIPGTVSDSGNSSLNCRVEISHSGKYLVEVLHKSVPLPGTPFVINVVQPPIPGNVRAFGPGLQDGLIGQEGSFTIETEDAGAGDLSVNVDGPKGGFEVKLNQSPKNERTILGSYNPQHAGRYVISIKWAGVEIPGSPFQVNIKEE